MCKTKSPEYQITIVVFSSLGDLVSCSSDLLLCNYKSPEYQITVTPVQAIPFILDAEVYHVLQVVGVANVAQPEGVASYVKTTEKRK